MDRFKAYESMTAEQILEDLKRQYAKQADAMEVIARAEKDLSYLQSEQYRGTQTPEQYAMMLAGHLHDWH